MSSPQSEDETPIPDPQQLARLYASGFGKLWNGPTEAHKALVITYSKLTREHVSVAKNLLELPHDVLDLFNDVGMVNWTAKLLIKAKTAQGIEALQVRAEAIKATNRKFGRKELLAILVGNVADFESVYQPREAFDPAALAETYAQGLREGRWLSMKEAEKVLKRQGAVTTACGIMDLPVEIRSLFKPLRSSLSTSTKLLSIEKIHGRDILIERAKKIQRRNAKFSADEIVAQLAGVPLSKRTSVKANVRVMRGRNKLVVEFHCEDTRLLLDRSGEFLRFIETGLASLGLAS